MTRLIVTTEVTILVFFVALSVLQVALMISAAIELGSMVRRQVPGGERQVLRSETAPAISVLAPAFNEEVMIIESVSALLSVDYPNLEVVVINDGSTDRTLDCLIEHYELHPIVSFNPTDVPSKPVTEVYGSPQTPRLIVIDKVQGGKADALNAGLGHAGGSLVCAVDADTILEPDALHKLASAFADKPSILAAGGSVRPLNGCTTHRGRVTSRRRPDTFLAGVQGVEYARAFLFGRLGWNRLGGNIIISGAFGLFDRDAMVTANGYTEDTVGEDMELVLRLRRSGIDNDGPNKVWFLPEPMAWTEVPESFRTLARQRNRWHRGLMDVLWQHKSMIGRPKYGAVGMLVLPYYFLELWAPVIEVVGLIVTIVGLATGIIDIETAGLFFVLAYGFGLALSAVSVGFEDRLDTGHASAQLGGKKYRWQILDQIGYRQLTVAWRIWGMWAWLRGSKEWGTQSRVGFSPASASDESDPTTTTATRIIGTAGGDRMTISHSVENYAIHALGADSVPSAAHLPS